MDLQVIASIQHPTPLRRLRFHPTLPLLATVDACRLAVHVWTWRDGDLLRLASLGEPEQERAEPDYGEGKSLDVAWHPTKPLLAVVGVGVGVGLWNVEPGGAEFLGWHKIRKIFPEEERSAEGGEVSSSGSQIAPDEGDVCSFFEGNFAPTKRAVKPEDERPGYSHVGFSLSGNSLWASPSEDVEWGGWCSDLFNVQGPGGGSKSWGWDTDLAHHPEGVLMAAFESNQGATLLRFASALEGPAGEELQTWRRAMVIDVDGYEGLSFSPRGDMLLFRGNAYENIGFVHAFPSLRLIAVVPFEHDEESPGGDWYSRLDETLPERWRRLRWSIRENFVFTPDGDSVLMGMHTGHLLELNLKTGQSEGAKIHPKPLCSLRVRHRDRLLAVTDFEGLLRLYKLPHTPVHPDTSSRPLTAAFLASTEPAPGRAGWDDLKLTDGQREWDEGALEGETSDNAPTWVRLGAAVRDMLKST